MGGKLGRRLGALVGSKWLRVAVYVVWLTFAVAVVHLAVTTEETLRRVAWVVVGILGGLSMGFNVGVEYMIYLGRRRKSGPVLSAEAARQAVLDEFDSSPEAKAASVSIMKRINDASKEYQPTFDALGKLLSAGTVLIGAVVLILTRLL